MTLAQRVMVMNKGVVEQVGTPVEVYERPASQFVASFIGAPAMNLLPGQIAMARALRSMRSTACHSAPAKHDGPTVR